MSHARLLALLCAVALAGAVAPAAAQEREGYVPPHVMPSRAAEAADPGWDPPPEGGTPEAEAGVAAGAPAPSAETSFAQPTPAQEGQAGRSGRFTFGSYGRVVVASDLDGGLGRNADIVAFGPRIDEGIYVELELRREDDLPEGMRSVVVSQLAVGGPLFHLDGRFEDSVAIRNLYAEVQNALVDGLDLWAGSRMVRGDDIYLLDTWLMDNLNALGGGFRLELGENGETADLAVTVGLTRPSDPFFEQTVTAVSPVGFGTDDVVLLDRPRFVLGTKATYYPIGRGAPRALKVSLYGEGHSLPSGQRRVNGEGLVDGAGVQTLPAETGYVLGAQVGAWIVESRSFLNLFFRYARGLAAYNPLQVPVREGGVLDLDRAREVRVGLSGNYESGPFGVQVGAYYRNFRDADPTLYESNRLAEGAVIARPHLWFGHHAGLALEASYQAMETTTFDERTGRAVRGGVTKLGVIPFLSPMGRGTYTRPHLRLIYSVTLRDADARRLYPELDPRSREKAEHFLGIGAEWWFDSTSYGR